MDRNLQLVLAGLLFKNNIALPSAKELVYKLCDFTHDEKKGFNGDSKFAVRLVKDISEVLNDSDSKNNEDDTGKTATQILIKLIEENIVLLFKD